MKYLMLYGPPEAGKLTVATLLAEQTGMLLFHNHHVVDFVSPMFPRGTLGYGRLIYAVRLAVFEEAVNSELLGLISTMVFAPSRQEVVASFCDAVEALGGEACLVQLTCAKEVLLERVSEPSRRGWKKLQTPEALEDALEKLEDPFQLIDGRSSLIIDTGITSPETAVAKIIDHYQLSKA